MDTPTENYPHIEDFVKGLKHPEETSHALYHVAKAYVEHTTPENSKQGEKAPANPSSQDMGEELSGDPHPISMDDYKRLKE